MEQESRVEDPVESGVKNAPGKRNDIEQCVYIIMANSTARRPAKQFRNIPTQW